MLEHALRKLVHVHHVLRHLADGLRRGAQLLLGLLLLHARLGEHLAQVVKLVAQRHVHPLDEHLRDAIHALHLRLRRREDEVIHRALHRQHGAHDALLHLHGHLLAHILHRLADVGRLLLLEREHGRVLRNRLGHGVQAEHLAEAVNRLLAFIRRAVVEQVEQQRAAHADNRGQERRAHAANQLIHRRQHDLGIRPRQAKAGKTHYQPQERAEDAQRGHHARREAGKARPPQRVNHRVFIDVLRHVAGLAVRVAHFGVLQKIRPRRGKRIAEEMHVVPRFFLFVLLAFGDDGSRRAAQSGRHAGERHGAARQRRRRDKHNRRVDDHIHREEFLKKCKCLHICCPPK